MFIDKNREIIHTSTFNIPERLKSIDNGYFMVRNHATNKFEVHHSKQIGGTLALILPFDELDERTLQYVKDTRIENSKEIYRKMDENNAKIEQDLINKRHDMGRDILTSMHKYLNTHESKETIDEDSKLVREGIAYE